ncbi:MAG: hypothetical protein LAQ30_23310 [Acidobacteriia bacterium]|nr:hypothetical protein [Terriglobia bacterium]
MPPTASPLGEECSGPKFPEREGWHGLQDVLKVTDMAKTHARKTTSVKVHQASTVELTKRGSNNSLQVQVRSGNALLGTLVMGQGSVQWWPKGNKTNDLKKTWVQFANILQKMMGR